MTAIGSAEEKKGLKKKVGKEISRERESSQ